FPDLDHQDYDIALIGVAEDRNAINNAGTSLAADHFREKFYALNEGNYTTKIVDIGNIKAGAQVSDTYSALKTVVAELIRKNILPVIIGGGQDLTYGQFMAYEELEQKVDLLVVDPQFDLDEDAEDTGDTTSQSYLNRIFLHEPNYLFNFSNIGYQTYFVNQESLRMMDKLYFDVHRLGDLSNKISTAEPVIRNANLMSFDMT